jgi:oxalate decarboxylase/phosphoglucose isomerase-like protein (cupin superfamily)
MLEQPKFVPKGWGCELWLANTPEYCGKVLSVHRFKRCSYHYHELKDETFFVQDGLIKLLYSMSEDSPDGAAEIVLEPGDSFHVPRLMRHQFIGLKHSHIIEVSTHHEDSDSYRLVLGDVLPEGGQ